MRSPDTRGIRMSELLAALSYALDLTEGQIEGHAVRSTLIGMRLAEAIGFSSEERSDLFYALLLKDAGCSSNSARTAELFHADDHAVKRSWKLVDWSHSGEAARHVFDNAMPESSTLRRALHLASFAFKGEVGTELVATRCERGAEIARMLGMSEATAQGIRALDEHWDGAGKPLGLAGPAIPIFGRILCLAQTADVFASAYGAEGALGVARARSGSWFDPELVSALELSCGDADFWRALQGPDIRERLAAHEPGDRTLLAGEDDLDRVAEAFARVIDAKTPFTYRHSEGVATMAESLASALGFDPPARRVLRRAALLHDIGKLGVSNTILDKPDRLDPDEIEQIRLHPLYTEQILGRAACFADIASIAAAHHERMDGSGYHRGVRAGELPLEHRVLAVADMYDALSADRPYRAALPRGEVLDIIRGQAGSGVCPLCVEGLEGC